MRSIKDHEPPFCAGDGRIEPACLVAWRAGEPVVEDDDVTRQMMRSMLEKAGWSVSEAENGRVALERVAANRPALILLDLTMPEMDGFEFAAELHRHVEWRSIPIVVLTAKDLTTEEVLRLKGSVHTILDKGGCSRSELMHQVRDLLAGGA